MKDKIKTKVLPVLDRFETHRNGKQVAIYRRKRVAINDKGEPDWNVQV